MTVRVQVDPRMLRWALERARREPADLASALPKLNSWLRGEVSPTLKQLQTFARRTHAPLGYLMLPEPPREDLPIPDFRTVRDATLREPSADLLDTIYVCERRQAWFRQHVRFEDRDRQLAWVGSASPGDSPAKVAQSMARVLEFDAHTRAGLRSWTDALRTLRDHAERAGILVMFNGIVASNTHRPLDPEEFRGFALSDDVAPLVFVNGADTKSAQMFTLAHEFAHLWLGSTGLSNVGMDAPSLEDERFCNEVAAEFLVPADEVSREHDASLPLQEEMQRLARVFRVSTLVVLRRLHDLGYLGTDAFHIAYRGEVARVLTIAREQRASGGGGNFYRTHLNRVSPTFASAVLSSALEGNTLYRDAMQLLSVSKVSIMDRMASTLGLVP